MNAGRTLKGVNRARNHEGVSRKPRKMELSSERADPRQNRLGPPRGGGRPVATEGLNLVWTGTAFENGPGLFVSRLSAEEKLRHQRFKFRAISPVRSKVKEWNVILVLA